MKIKLTRNNVKFSDAKNKMRFRWVVTLEYVLADDQLLVVFFQNQNHKSLKRQLGQLTVFNLN